LDLPWILVFDVWIFIMTSPPDKIKRHPKAQAPCLDPSGEHFARRLKQLRTERNWSLDTLAHASGVSRSMLSQVERNQANPTLAVAMRIARAFGMALGDLAETPGATSSLVVIRVSDHAYHYRSDKDCKIRTLSPLHLEKDVEFYEVQLNEGGALRSSAHFEGTREFLTVQKGRVRVESAGDSEELTRGDSVNYRADVPHAIVNSGKGEAVVFLVDIYR
jgi:transcriptional regulator with XRE-family HTH domain